MTDGSLFLCPKHSKLLNVSMMWLINGEGEGIENPDAEAPPAEMTEIILEIREMKSDLHFKAEQLARLEKRLRTLVTQTT